MTQVFLIRHARPSAVWGEADPDPGLDPTGQAQAEAAAQVLMALDPSVRPRRVVSSPLRRCRETAEPFAKALGVEIEIDLRVSEIPTPAAISPADRSAWLRSAFDRRWSDIEGDLDYEVWRDDVAAALLARPGAAIFSHFVAINAAVAVATGSDLVRTAQPDHAAIATFDVSNGRLTLLEPPRSAQTSIL